MTNDPSRLDNRLLAALSDGDFDLPRPHLTPVDLIPGTPVFHAGEGASHVWFPYLGVISIVAGDADGKTVEIATVGREGMTGVSLVLGSETMTNDAMVQVAGHGSRMEVAAFHAAVDVSPSLKQMMLRYELAVITQISQNAACNQLHAINTRCARWLLTTHDRVGGDSFGLLSVSVLRQARQPIGSIVSSARASPPSGPRSGRRGRTRTASLSMSAAIWSPFRAASSCGSSPRATTPKRRGGAVMTPTLFHPRTQFRIPPGVRWPLPFCAVQDRGPCFVWEAMSKAMNPGGFAADDDPHGAHDAGSFDVTCQRVVWAIDYLQRGTPFSAEAPDFAATCRIITIMLDEEG